MKILKKRGGGSREKGGGGNEIHAPCACGFYIDSLFCRRGAHYKQEQCVSLFFQTGKSHVRHFCCLLLSTCKVKYFLNCLDTIQQNN